MRKLLKNWCLGSTFILSVSTLVFMFVGALYLDYRNDILFVFIGFLISSVLFFTFGLINNNKIAKKIININNIAKSSLPKDILNRGLYSNSHTGDEIEVLRCDIENVIFEIKASERIKNDFISSMSHELRTPLTAIKGWAETMKTGDLIDFSTVRRGLEVIIKEASRLSKIVDELLDFSVISSGRLMYNMEVIDILAEVEDAVYIFKERASAEQKTFTYNEPKLPLFVYGDKSRLQQVFVNVIDNALKYTGPNGSISISVSEEEKKAVFKVTDNGCGIDKAEIPNVTQRFYKSRESGTKQKGCGIGLSIVKEIVAAHNGNFQILSEKGIGTTVTISFDLISKDNFSK